MFDRILVAFDGTEGSRRALKAGIDLCQKLHRPLNTISVAEQTPGYLASAGLAPEVMGEIARAADNQLAILTEEVKTAAKAAELEVTCYTAAGEEVSSIIDAVKEVNADLLVVGIRSHPGLVDRLVSHTARDISERSPCSILGVK